MSTSLRVLIFLVATFAVAGGALALMSMSKSDKGGSSGGGVSSELWEVGDTWTVKVRQDSASISPDTTKSVALIPYRFKVASAPAKADGEWVVKVTQDGAEGPFADGWRLTYVERDGAMVLKRVGAGDQRLIEAEVAGIVLGSNFPYELKYTKAPTSFTIDSAELNERMAKLTPPSPEVLTTPQGGKQIESGARPPVDAPILKAGELPPGAPPVGAGKP